MSYAKKAMITSTVAVVFLLSVVGQIQAYPNGAPSAACASMTPGHGVGGQQSASPFTTATLDGEIALPRSTVRLELRPHHGEITFRGYLVMAFDRNDDSKPIGMFQQPRDGKLIDCSGGMQNAVTHSNNNDKKSVTVTWVPPSDYSGQVVFKTTFVQNHVTFWVKTESNAVSFVTETSGSSQMLPKPTESSAPPSTGTFVNFITLSLMAVAVL